jgi:hypothetical protein
MTIGGALAKPVANAHLLWKRKTGATAPDLRWERNVTLGKIWAGAAVLLALAACNSGPPSEATERMQAERYCADGPFARGSKAFDYCVDQKLAQSRRNNDDAKRLYDSTIRNIPTTPAPR